MHIPKLIHLTWKEKDILLSQSPLILNGVGNIKNINPEWDIQISNDTELSYYLKNYLSDKHYQTAISLKAAEKSDIWRLLKMYYEGGIYIDIDRFFNVNLNNIIDDKVKCILPMCEYNDFSQDIMISMQGNPLYLKVLDTIFYHRDNGVTNTYFLGPQTYMHCVTEMVCGKVLNTNPGKDIMLDIANTINTSSFMKCIIEYPPYNTLVYNHNALNFKKGDIELTDWQLLKENLYDRYKVKHWTGLW